MYTNFFSKIDISPDNTNILNGEAEDLLEECAEYERKIKRVGGIDIFLGGMGEDGHLAFNEASHSHGSDRRSGLTSRLHAAGILPRLAHPHQDSRLRHHPCQRSIFQ